MKRGPQHQPRDLAGQSFDLMTAVVLERSVKGHAYWRCRCICGNEKVVRGSHLTSGNCLSCGCVRRSRNNRTVTNPREYSTWRNMLGRCEDPKHVKYPLYGARGIKVCMAWHDFERFLADMGPRPAGTTIDRIDPDGHYQPGNCRWATTLQQRHNRRAA